MINVALVSALFFSLSVSASDCLLPANFPSNYKTGQTFPISELADSGDIVRISGQIKIVSGCSFQFIDFSLTNAIQARHIQVYGKNPLISFPVSTQIISGDFSNALGPLIEFTDTKTFVVTNTSPGVSWGDFSELTIYSVATKTVLAKIFLPEVGPPVESTEPVAAPVAPEVPAGPATPAPKTVDAPATGGKKETLAKDPKSNAFSIAPMVLNVAAVVMIICSF